MSDKITYTLAVMRGAPHGAQAITFEQFILTGRGKAILQEAGVQYLDTPRTIVP
jgi:ABC-type molybdate transport system substrate-binding protein